MNENPGDQPATRSRRKRDDIPDLISPFFSPSHKRDAATLDRLLGTVIGSAVGDALGAPFEFGPPGAFTARFTTAGSENEMVGGGACDWLPGEFTDDTQMAVLEAQSIVSHESIDEIDIFGSFQAWLASGPKDVGLSTRSVLTDPAGWPTAPRNQFARHPNSSAGNGAVMRASFAAARWAGVSLTGTAEVARRLSVVTHGDPAAGEGRALLHMLIHDAANGRDPFDPVRFDMNFEYIKDDQRERLFQIVSEPTPSIGNGTVWGCLRDSLSSVRASDSFEEAMRRACDVGGDVDTVAAVAGALAGAVFGLSDVPARWVETLRGDVGGVPIRVEDLIGLTHQMLDFEESETKYKYAKGWRPDRTEVRYGYGEYFGESWADI